MYNLVAYRQCADNKRQAVVHAAADSRDHYIDAIAGDQRSNTTGILDYKRRNSSRQREQAYSQLAQRTGISSELKIADRRPETLPRRANIS